MNREHAVGWTAIVLSTLVVSFWGWWGITDNFHEGWFYASFLRNVEFMLYRFMSPMIVFLSLGILAAAVPRVGGPLHILVAVLIPLLFPGRNLLAMLLMIVPLLVLGVLYYRSSPPPFLHAVIILAVFPILLTMVLAIEPIIRISNRVDDGYLGARVIHGNGVTLVWAPEGPGWPNTSISWEDASQICLHLTVDGRAISDSVQGIWRLPTVDEAVRSMVRHEVNCNGIWNPTAARAYYDKIPDKESPLWKIYSPVVYWWTSTETDAGHAYRIVCNGEVFRTDKRTRDRNLSFRAVRAVTERDTAPAAQAAAPDSNGLRGKLVHTFSIVARDTVTGELGVAVQSHWFSVGSSVTWAEAGVGAVATQSFIDPSYGPLGLNLMRAGKSARQALDALLASDPGKDVRQVAMVDAHGAVATHTGSKCIESAGHFTGRNYSVQANLMLNDKVWPAMSRAFETARGDLADRMLAALDAGQSVGGDIRGKQSAAILIVSGQSTGRPWADKVMDLRVDDSPEPLKELRRLVVVQRAYAHMNNGDLAVEHNDVDGALREYGSAEAMFPGNLEMKFWHAVALVNVGRADQSLPMFKEIFAKDANWATLIPRLPASGTLTADKATIDKILALAPKK